MLIFFYTHFMLDHQSFFPVSDSVSKEKGSAVNMRVIMKLATCVLQGIYFFFKLLPVKNQIVMISRQSDKPPFEFLMLKKEINRKDKTVNTVILSKTMGRAIDGAQLKSVLHSILYLPHIFLQMFYLATSRVAVLDGYCVTASLLKHKRTLRTVQMWHSMGTMKLFGWAILDKEEGSSRKIAEIMRMHANYDYYFASSSAYQEHLARGFGCSEQKARIFPLPRYDLLRDKAYQMKKQAEIYHTYPKLKGKKIIVYCPTFRKDETMMQQAIINLENAVPDGYCLIIKLHPLSKLQIQGKNSLCDSLFTTMDMLFIADYVISDYSCVIYEAAVLNIPLSFYVFDFGHYEESRGFAIDYMNELPGIISKDPQEIMRHIREDDFDREELRRFTDKYVKKTEHATSDITDFLLMLLKEK